MKIICSLFLFLISFNCFSQETIEFKPTLRIDGGINQGFISKSKSAIGINIGLNADDIASVEFGIQMNEHDFLYNFLSVYKITNFYYSGVGFTFPQTEMVKHSVFWENQIRPYNDENFAFIVFHRLHWKEYSTIGFGGQFKF